MADFEKAFYVTMAHEGGYSHDSTDAGGETYRGISRVYNPTWGGWAYIDEAKSESNFPKNLDDDEDIQDRVEDFYKDKYWDVNRLDEFPQSIAEEMFDTGVNMGVGRAAKFLQECLNYLNRNGEVFKDLVEDGAIGPASIGAMKKIISLGDEAILLTMLNVCQGRHYMEYMKKSPTQEKYARGWFSRVKISKEE